MHVQTANCYFAHTTFPSIQIILGTQVSLVHENERYVDSSDLVQNIMDDVQLRGSSPKLIDEQSSSGTRYIELDLN